MTSPARSLTRDEASVTSPFRNAIASSYTSKPSHSPFVTRCARPNNDSTYTRYSTHNNTTRPPDAISTSSSTLVNADIASDYRPWEVRSEASTSSLDSATISRGGRATPTLSALDDLGTLPSIHISPLPSRAGARNNRQQQAQGQISNESGRRSVDSSLTRARPARQLCPDDCRCSDQDIDLGLCRRVVGSSSSGSDSGSLSVGMHLMRQRGSDPATEIDTSGRNDGMQASSNQPADYSQQSSHSQSESRSQGRDFEKDPILVPRSSRTRSAGRSSTSTYQHSFDQLQRGLDTLESSESDVEDDADQALAAQRRAESMARWTARRASLSRSSNNHRGSMADKLDAPPETKQTPSRPARSLASDTSLPARRTPESKVIEEYASPLLSTPLKATPGRKSIAAVFESMQKEREARAAEEHKQWQEKQARRERERAARAFGMPSRRRTSASSSQFDSPVSATTSAFDTPGSQNNNTTAYQSMMSNTTTATAYQSMMTSRGTPSRSPVSSIANASPSLSSPGSPKVDESAAADHVQPRHLGEEAAGRIPETLAEDEEQASEDQRSDVEPEAEGTAPVQETQEVEALPTTPQTKHTSAFAFTSQPMTLDLSPVRSLSDFSSPASSPRKNAHRRQNTNTVSVAARLPPASLGAARQRLNAVLGSTPDEASPVQHKAEEKTEQIRGEQAFPQTPINGILSSAKKSFPRFSAARRGHSVRFSPRPDYRSDSGSWDESGTTSNVGEDSREAAVERLLLPAKEITIPDVFASASTPLQTGAEITPVETATAEAEEELVAQEPFETVDEQEQRELSPAKSTKVETVEMVSKQHSPSPTKPSLPLLHDTSSASVSQSVRFPGAYQPTPVKSKSYSRHIIRPSPKVSRTNILPFTPGPSHTTQTTPSGGATFGLFPTSTSSEGLEIPRESTPPPQMLGPEDPRNSPRSPRPVNLGREQFGQFHTGSSSDDSGGSMVEANTKANESVGDNSGIQGTIGRILRTVEATHSSKIRRMELGEKLNAAGERVKDIASSTNRPSAPMEEGSGAGELEEQEVRDKLKAEELRNEVMSALTHLVEQLSQLQTQPSTTTPGDVSSTSHTSTTTVVAGGRKPLPRWILVVLVVAQCALMAFLLGVAEKKAQRMRMFHPAQDYHTQSSSSQGIEWNAIAVEPYLTPLVSVPGLKHLAQVYPPLPSPSTLNLIHDHKTTLLQLYRSYITLNGIRAFTVQLAVYAISQLISVVLLLLLAPIQVLWFLIQPSAV